MEWFLHRLDYRDGSYHPVLLKGFDTLEAAMGEQRKMSGVNTQVSNVRCERPHKIYTL